METTTYSLAPWSLSDLFPGSASPEMQTAFDELERRTAAFENHRLELMGEPLQLGEVGWRSSEHEVEVNSSDRRALNRGCRIANQNGFEPHRGQRGHHGIEQWHRIHVRLRKR